MKKIYFLLLSTFLSFILSAQPVITDAIAPEIGDAWEITFLEVNNFEPGLGGPDQTWDFSDLDLSNSLDLNMSILDPTTISNGPSFPTADFVWYLGGFEVYNYYSVNEDSISLVGGASIQAGSVDFLTEFIDPEDGLQFPITLGDSYTYYSFFEQTVLGIPLGTNERNGIVVADGYGTLITPDGSYDNILRLVITETSFGFTSTQYAWMDVNNFVPVFLYETSDDPDTPPSLYFSTPNIVNPVLEIDQQTVAWDSWYSKDAQGIIVDLSSLEIIKPIDVQVYTMDGKLITSDSANPGDSRLLINLPSSIESAALVISLITDKVRSSKKIPVMR